MNKLNSRDLVSIIESVAGGTFFSVTFVKKDGSVRNMVCRLGVKKGLVGSQRTTDPSQYLIVWDSAAKGYRNVNKDSMLSIKVRGQEYKAEESWSMVA